MLKNPDGLPPISQEDFNNVKLLIKHFLIKTLRDGKKLKEFLNSILG